MATKLRRASRLIALLLFPPVVVIAVLGRQLLSVFGATYAVHSHGLLLLFLIVVIPDAVTNVYVTVLRVQGLPQKAAVMNLGMALVALAGGWWLMGLFGVAGAAWAWALSQGVGCCYVACDAYLTRGSFPRSSAGKESGMADHLAKLEDADSHELG
jgi:O-antigen/teichoic acid export membrane protein